VITEEPPEPEPPDDPADDIDDNVGTLIVEVVVEGRPNFDFGQVTVTVQGTTQDGNELSRTLVNREDNVWTEEDVPVSQGEYTIEAIEANPLTLSGAVTEAVRAGQTTTAFITLRPTSNIAKTFIIHFRFDKAFVEPCMRPVLKQVAQYAEAHPDEKLLIVGHTDKAGPPAYNQSLSERRARSVFAFLTAGVDENARRDALTDWDALRQTQQDGGPRVQDNWGVREYQHILQHLNFYPGMVDGQEGPLTRDAVEAYRCHKGLPPGSNVDDDVWRALIEDYLTQEPLAVPPNHFFPNCEGEILKWLGCGEDDPLDRRSTAFRPSRRVEILFVRVDNLPCDVPQPVTFNLSPGATVNNNWCRDSGAATSRCCIVSPHLQPNGQPQPCPTDPDGPWCRQDAEPGQITVVVSIQRELPDGTLDPVPDQPFVLVSPKGEFKAGEQSNGEPIPARTTGSSDPNPGTFTFPNMPIGHYSLEVITPVSSPVLVRLLEEDDSAIRGNAVCKVLRADPQMPVPPKRLDVVIVNAPTLREIRLPVVAHLMTALHPVTREIRTCPDPLNPARRIPQATIHTADEVIEFIDEVNRVWRQARVRLELDSDNIVEEAYAFRTECQVDQNEFSNVLLQRCAYPNALNVFFIADLVGQAEAGFGVSPEAGAALGISGIAVGDRFQHSALGAPASVLLNDQQTVQVLAHEVGHYLNLADQSNTPANADRLMMENTVAGVNRRLTQSEVSQARSSQGATDDCVPLSLEVTGATRVGGPLSHQFIFVQHPELVEPFEITIDAKIPEHLLTRGTLIMSGGNPGANNLQQTVSKNTTGEFEIVATYTPSGAGQPVSERVEILVVTFNLRVDGATEISPGSNLFVTSHDTTDLITVIADVDPALFCVPKSLVAWEGGNAAPDPLRRTVSRSTAGSTIVRATIAGETRTATINVIKVTVPVITLVGLDQTLNVPIRTEPSPLPPDVSIRLQIRRTTGTGEARFPSTNSTIKDIAGSTAVAVRGTTVSSVADNLRLEATISGRPEIIAQEELTVVGATIDDVVAVRPGQTIDVPITVTPSPLPPGGTLTLELSTATGTGEARFASGDPTVKIINQTTTVTVRGVTPSSTTDNIRLTVRITGQTQVLAQEEFTVLNRINIFLKFEVWNLNTHTFEPLPSGLAVELVDEDIGPDDTLATQQTDDQGRVLFNLPNFGTSGEDEPDLYFLVQSNGRFHAGHLLPDEWATKGWRATDGSPGLFDDFTGTQLGSEAAPLTYRIGLDFHARLRYDVDAGGRAGLTDPAPIGSGISFLVNNDRRRTFLTDVNGEVHGVIFDVEGGDRVSIRVDFDIRDSAINMNRAIVDIDQWETEFDDNDQTSIATHAAPLVLHANSDDRNVALYFLKLLRELSTFLFHMTGGIWTGFDELEFNRSSISGVAFSWPVGSVNLPPTDHWDRGTIIHEMTHQIMWKEHNRSSANVAFEAIFGQLSLTHFETLLTNPEHALIEGWAELMQVIFEGIGTLNFPIIDASGTRIVEDRSGNIRPLGPPPNNRGESVEGAYASGMWAIFENHVVTATVTANANIPESVDGDVTATAPWITNANVRQRFLAMIWEPFRNLSGGASDPTTTQMFARIRARNAALWHLLQPELQAFNMAMDIPSITSLSPNSGPSAGGQRVTIRGTNFVSGMQVQFAQAPPGGGPALNVSVTNSTTLTADTPSGVVGSANVIVTTLAGSDTLVGSYTYV